MMRLIMLPVLVNKYKHKNMEFIALKYKTYILI